MLTLSTLFALLLRISLLCQSQVEGLSDSAQLAFFEGQEIQSDESHIQSSFVSFEGSASLLPAIEIEERSEVESNACISTQAIFAFKEPVKDKSVLLYNNKALRGSRLPLYDFFHTWKIHLS